MSDPNGDDRTDVQVTVPVPVSSTTNVDVTLGYSQDNVYNASTPSQLQNHPGDKGTQVEWTIGTFDDAITWLTAHADYLDRMYHGTHQIEDLIKGPAHSSTDSQWMDNSDGPVTSLGGFRWARTLAKQHAQLLTETQQQLKTVVEELRSAADALGQVRDKYHDAEHASAMSATEFESVFSGNG